VLARGRGVSIIGVALLASEPFIGGGDIDVALTEPLAGTQTQAGLPE